MTTNKTDFAAILIELTQAWNPGVKYGTPKNTLEFRELMNRACIAVKAKPAQPAPPKPKPKPKPKAK
tara:strand:- start:935 stop:1135 length:201 start_codon:yes stop_codon:yes gene_type:complete